MNLSSKTKKVGAALAKSLPAAAFSVFALAALSVFSFGPTPVAEAVPAPVLSGYAWSENIGWISFQDSPQPVQVDDVGALSGYAWSENIGWIKFGGLSRFPASGLGANAVLEEGRTMTGWARACAGTKNGDCSSMAPRTDGWDGWISLRGSGYGVVLNDRSFAGYAWGSDVVGWIDWAGVFSDTDIGSCFGPNGELILNGQSRTYYSEESTDGTCAQETRTCVEGTLSDGNYTALRCGNPLAECSRGTLRLQEGESQIFYSERVVSGATEACAGVSDIRTCCDLVAETLTCTQDGLVDEEGVLNLSHNYSRCSAAPRASEF